MKTKGNKRVLQSHRFNLNMSLVEYSSSDEEKSEKLELPPGLQGLSSDCFRFSVREEDPSRHNYRSRTFPHEPGSWATSIYIACPHFYSRIQEAIKSPIIQLNPIINDCCAVDFLHISLSKTWPIYFHWIENLACNLRSAVSSIEKSFFTLITSEESRVALTPLLSSVDSCVTAFRGPAYYKGELRIALFAETKQLYHEVTDIVCKSGNKYFDISLL
ncbi:U6 snRNA phosphodiesterase [Schistosoma japonicum]|nr:U6 snRNA phosphodiesterase [Schistosoma japonicum]